MMGEKIFMDFLNFPSMNLLIRFAWCMECRESTYLQCDKPGKIVQPSRYLHTIGSTILKITGKIFQVIFKLAILENDRLLLENK